MEHLPSLLADPNTHESDLVRISEWHVAGFDVLDVFDAGKDGHYLLQFWRESFIQIAD